jgi:hypothetical protein
VSFELSMSEVRLNGAKFDPFSRIVFPPVSGPQPGVSSLTIA